MRALFSALLLTAVGFAVSAPAFAENDEPTPRFEDALCPGVAGLPTETAELLVGRIRQNAQALGRTMAPPETCEANLIVAIVPDGRAAMLEMSRQQSFAFTEMNPTERKALLSEAGPVHVLSRVFTRTRDGLPVYRRESLTDVPEAAM